MISICKISTAFGSLLVLAASLAPASAFANGECLAWNVAGSWHITQSNGNHVTLHLQQTDTHLQGVGEYSYYNNDDNKVQTIGGPLDGMLESGFRVRVTAYWSNGTAGQYVGEVHADGGMSGYTVDVNDPGNKATFVASGNPQCVTQAAPPPPAPPTMALGRVHVPAGAPASPTKTMCEMAASALARNSPAAPTLAKRCAEEGGPAPSVGFGRVPTPAATPTTTPSGPPPPTAPPPFDPTVLDTLAATGADIAQIDPAVAEAREAETGTFYQLGFDIATGLFGDPALGAQGNTLMGPESERIRGTLSAAGQRGFDDSMKLHLARDYSH